MHVGSGEVIECGRQRGVDRNLVGTQCEVRGRVGRPVVHEAERERAGRRVGDELHGLLLGGWRGSVIPTGWSNSRENQLGTICREVRDVFKLSIVDEVHTEDVCGRRRCRVVKGDGDVARSDGGQRFECGLDVGGERGVVGRIHDRSGSFSGHFDREGSTGRRRVSDGFDSQRLDVDPFQRTAESDVPNVGRSSGTRDGQARAGQSNDRICQCGLHDGRGRVKSQIDRCVTHVVMQERQRKRTGLAIGIECDSLRFRADPRQVGGCRSRHGLADLRLLDRRSDGGRSHRHLERSEVLTRQSSRKLDNQRATVEADDTHVGSGDSREGGCQSGVDRGLICIQCDRAGRVCRPAACDAQYKRASLCGGRDLYGLTFGNSGLTLLPSRGNRLHMSQPRAVGNEVRHIGERPTIEVVDTESLRGRGRSRGIERYRDVPRADGIVRRKGRLNVACQRRGVRRVRDRSRGLPRSRQFERAGAALRVGERFDSQRLNVDAGQRAAKRHVPNSGSVARDRQACSRKTGDRIRERGLDGGGIGIQRHRRRFVVDPFVGKRQIEETGLAAAIDRDLLRLGDTRSPNSCRFDPRLCSFSCGNMAGNARVRSDEPNRSAPFKAVADT